MIITVTVFDEVAKPTQNICTHISQLSFVLITATTQDVRNKIQHLLCIVASLVKVITTVMKSLGHDDYYRHGLRFVRNTDTNHV